jgi:hypothetical protein
MFVCDPDTPVAARNIKVGLKKSSLMTNGKLLITQGQASTKMSGVSTTTKFRTDQKIVARLTVRNDPCVFWQVVDLLPDR